MPKSLSERTRLNNGVEMPWFGLGVYKAEEGDEVVRSVRTALDHGYRLIDTAAFYRNEEGVGKAIRNPESPGKRFLSPPRCGMINKGTHPPPAFEESRKKLGLDGSIST